MLYFIHSYIFPGPLAIIIMNGVYVTTVVQEDRPIVIGLYSSMIVIPWSSVGVGTREGRDAYIMCWLGRVLEMIETECFEAAGRSYPCFSKTFLAYLVDYSNISRCCLGGESCCQEATQQPICTFL